MKRNSLLAMIAILGAAVVNSLTGAQAAEFKLPDTDATPAELVNAALRSELDGPSDVRKTLLDRALELDPNYAPARWHSGYVKYDDQWLTLDEVAKRASDDKQLAEYRKRRDALIDRAEDHRELARWCKKHGLTEEARVHWAKVLEFDPADSEALAELGLQLYEGQLLTKQQIAQAKKQAGERMQAMKRWQPQMVKWRKAIESLKGREYKIALHELRKLTDVEALPALEAAFAENRGGAKADALNLALIEVAGRMQSPEATQVLLRRAIQPESTAVRAAACDQLKKRPMYVYVPQLIAAIPGKIKTRFNIFVLPDGMVLHEHEVFLEGREADASLKYTSSVMPGNATVATLATPSAVTDAAGKSAQLEAALAPSRAQLEWLRDRVQFALSRTTGFESAEDPELWRKHYNDHYRWAHESRTKPRFYAAFERNQAVTAAPVHTEVNNTDVYRDPTIPEVQQFYECFRAGTPVATLAGLRPIESLTTGDRVLSQDPKTGELSYQVVQNRTLRVVPELLRMRTDDAREIDTTLGHPFWVVGEGWRVAHQLRAGDRLHALGGTVVLESVERVAPSEVYNLVVSGPHNYFVGKAGLLAHDNTPLVESGAALPGLRFAESTR